MSREESIKALAVCEIPLDQDRIALVDVADHRFLRLFNWRAVTYGSDKWYAVTRAPALRTDVMMHRVIAAAEDGFHVDHINGNGLDNRRANLRLATPAQNAANRRPRRGASSRFKGVSWDEDGSRWVARIFAGDRDVHLGRFESDIAAARAYNRAAAEVYGEFAYMNPVPDDPEDDQFARPRKPGRKPKPWYWSGRDCWCLQYKGKRVILARGRENEDRAFEAFRRLMRRHGLEVPDGTT